MSLSPREREGVRHLAEHRYLSRAQIEEFLFGGSTLMPNSRRVITWRVLARLEFYAIIIVATALGTALNFLGVDPMLFWTAVINGVVAPPLLVLVMLRRATVASWATSGSGRC